MLGTWFVKGLSANPTKGSNTQTIHRQIAGLQQKAYLKVIKGLTTHLTDYFTKGSSLNFTSNITQI